VSAPNAELDLAPRAPFTEKVLGAVSRIAPGDTRSFEDVAAEVGDRAAARAVGRVLARNPLPIFIPCHRVVTKQGELSGYIGGARWKQFLLDLETGQLHLTKRKRRSRARHD
jgi:methylated-DNA-[protein]-cysteine S-methyltransferase